MNIFQQPELSSIEALLGVNDLPIADLEELNLECFFGCDHKNCPGGVIGVEFMGEAGFLRSLVVSSGVRGQGCGQALVDKLEEFTAGTGVQNLYLLTETAEDLFSKLGYLRIDRESVSDAIKSTTGFSSLWPDDAVVMCKSLVTSF